MIFTGAGRFAAARGEQDPLDEGVATRTSNGSDCTTTPPGDVIASLQPYAGLVDQRTAVTLI